VVAVTWRMTGVTWRAITPILGVAFSIVSVTTYGLFRSQFGRFVSLVGATVMMLSPVQLANLPHLRDYSKAPFILGLMAIGVWLTLREWSARAVLIFAAVTGVLLGIGLGFRNDVLIAMPPALVLFGVLVPVAGIGRVRWRLCAVGVLLMAFLTAGYPILR